MSENELIVHQQSLVKPVGDGKDLSEAITAYKDVQESLDKALPGCIMSIQGKQFRKKNYWRAVKTAFNLKVECEKEERIFLTDDDWGYEVTYRATAPNGASADGDGACTFSEKNKGCMEASLHNIRSQAHTRAFNRAVSNLVGFGEVSAEEINHSDAKGAIKPSTGKKAMQPEQTKLWALMVQVFKDPKKIKKQLIQLSSFTPTKGDNAGQLVKGKESIYDITEKHAKVIRKNLEKSVEDSKAKPQDVDIEKRDKCMTCTERNECDRDPAPDCGFYVYEVPPEEVTVQEPM